MSDPLFVNLNGPRSTWVQVSRIAIIQDTNDGCEVRVLNDVGWTVLTSYESADALMQRIGRATVN